MANDEQRARVRKAAGALGVDEGLLLRLVETEAFRVNYLTLMSDDRDRRPPAEATPDTGAGESS